MFSAFIIKIQMVFYLLTNGQYWPDVMKSNPKYAALFKGKALQAKADL